MDDEKKMQEGVTKKMKTEMNFCSAADTTSLFVFQDNLPLLQFHSLSNNDTQSVLLRFKMYPLPRHMRTNMDMC